MAKKAPEQKAHVALGASTCERWWNCPGSVALCEGLSSKPSYAAAEGTAAHEVAEKALRNLIDPEVSVVHAYKPGDVIKVDGFDIIVTKEMIGHVDTYVDYISELIEAYKIEAQHVLIEERVRIPHPSQILSGTADCILILPFNRIKVIDLKYGAGTKVNAKNNKQCMYYGLGALFALPKWMRDDIDQVDNIIAQPRMGGIESATVSKDDMREFNMDLSLAASATQSPTAPLVTGAHCKYCPAKLTCPALRETVQDQAGVDFAAVNPLMPVPSNGPTGLPAPQHLAPEVVARIMDHTAVIKSWLQEVHDHAYDLINNGTYIPGYKLVDKRSQRKWINEPAAENVLVSFLGNEAYATQKILSPAQAEKRMKGIDLSSLIEKPNNGKTIARDDDSRESIDAEIISDFDGV